MYTGLTRRIDDLGRIVIPKEIRESLNIKDGDLLDIGTQGHEITIRKHYPLDNVDDYFDDLKVFLSLAAANSGVSEEKCKKLDDKIYELKEFFYDFF